MIKTCHTPDETAYLIGILQTLSVKGVCAEIGVYEGATAKIIREEAPDVDIHLFDTFVGILPYQAEEDWKDGDYYSTLKEVKKNIGEDFIFHKGDIVGTKTSVRKSEFAFIHFDLDIYKPLSESLDYFYKRLTKNGIMLVSNCDEAHPGVMLALEEFKKPYTQYSRYRLFKKI